MRPVLWVVAGGFLLSGISPAQSLLDQERVKRRDQVIQAEEDVLAGDTSYRSGEFDAAVSSYRSAYSKLSEGEKTAVLRAAVRERYAQAAVEAAKEMNRKGRRDDAIKLMDEVLGDTVAPDYVPAQLMREKLDDPIRTNPAATPEHAENVDEVRRLLYLAEGAYNAADFDAANEHYQNVLRRDPYNKAARRGMERCSAAISDYATAARDQTRAQMLSEVDGGWELPDKNVIDESLLMQNVGAIGEGAAAHDIHQKLDDLIVPFLAFEDTNLREAVEYLEAQSFNLDQSIDEASRGISFVIDTGSGDSPEITEILNRPFSLQLRNVPLRQVLEYVCRQTSTAYRVDSHAVVIYPLAGATDTLVLRRYKVPPAFMTQSSSPVVDDIFGDSGDDGPKLAPRLTAKEILENSGISFPDGATASYSSGLGELFVKNTSSNHELIEQILNTMLESEPVQIIVESKIVRIRQQNIEELMTDVVFENFIASGDFSFNGGAGGNGRPVDPYAMTSGLRSGDYALNGDPLAALLDRDPSSRATSLQSAPGFLSALGLFDDNAVFALLRGLENKKGVDLLNQSSVVTRSGEQAVIESGRRLIYPTEYEPPEIPNNVGADTFTDFTTGQSVSPTSFAPTPSHPTAFEDRVVGTVLEVQPVVSSRDRNLVDLTITPTISEFLGFINYGEPLYGGSTQADFALGAGFTVTGQSGEVSPNDILMPLFDTVRASTSLTIQNNQTIVLGGLLSEKVEKVEDKVPILGDLPLVGRAFQSDVHLREKHLVMIFVTVRVVDPGGNSYQPN